MVLSVELSDFVRDFQRTLFRQHFNMDKLAKIKELCLSYMHARENDTSLSITDICLIYPELQPELEINLKHAIIIRDAWLKSNLSKPEIPLLAEKETKSKRDTTTFGHYDRLIFLGRGSFANVYRAFRVSPVKRDDHQEEIVAIKILRKEWSNNEEVVNRFKNEAELSKLLKHPNIVSINEYGVINGRHYLEMQFIHGKSLSDRSGRLDLVDHQQAITIAVDVARACDAAHQKDYFHRDIKLENILVENNTGKASVIDFGLACSDHGPALTHIDQVLGTPGYRSPEQVDPSTFGKVGPASDIYAIGVVLHLLLTGVYPFQDPAFTDRRTLIKHFKNRSIFSPLSRRSVISGPLRRICNKCLETYPEHRYSNASLLAEDLENYLNRRPIRAAWRSPLTRAIKAGRVKPFTAGSLISALLIVFTAVGFALSFRTAKIRADSARYFRDYDSDLLSVQELLEQRQFSAASQLLEKYEYPRDIDPRGFEWFYWKRLVSAQWPSELSIRGENWNRPTFDTRGNRLALIDDDGKASIFSATSGEKLYFIDSTAYDISFGNNDAFCALLTRKQQAGVEVRQANDGRLLYSFGEDKCLTSMTCDPLDSCIFTGQDDGTIFAWMLNSDQSRYVPALEIVHESSPKSETSPEQSHEVLTSDRSNAPFSRINSAVTTLLITEERKLFAGFANGRVRLWNIKKSNGTLYASIASEDLTIGETISHRGPVTGFAKHPRRGMYATQSAGHPLRYDASPGELKVWGNDIMIPVRSYSLHSSGLFSPHDVAENDLWHYAYYGRLQPIFGDDGLLYCASDHGVVVKDPSSDGPPIDYLLGESNITGLASKGAKVAAVESSGKAVIWDLNDRYDGTVIWRATPVQSSVYSFAIDNTEKTLAVSKLWSFGEMSLKAKHAMFGYVPVGLEILNLNSGEILFDVLESRSPEDRKSKFHIQPSISFPMSESSVLFAGHRVLLGEKKSGGPNYLKAMGYDERESKDGSVSVRLAYNLRDILLFRSDSPKETKLSGHAAEIVSYILSEDGSIVVAGCSDGTTILWSGKDQTLLGRIQHSTTVTALALDSNNSLLAVGLDDGLIEVFDLENLRPIATLLGHRRSITGISFVPDQSRLASCSGLAFRKSSHTGKLLLHDLRTHQICAELKSRRQNLYSALQTNRDGTAIYASANAFSTLGEGEILIWRSEDN